jgi:hypothetical protein
MKLPSGEKAQLGDKLEKYCLNLNHRQGKDKAIMFRDKLGITLSNKHILEQALLVAAINAIIYKIDEYGTHYDIKFNLTTEQGTSLILSSWIIRNQEDFPRLTNTYPVKK